MIINNNFPSSNYSIRIKQIEYIIIHFTEMSFLPALNRLRDESAKVSTHYLIKEDGEIFQLVDDTNIAWHAGKSNWHDVEALNQNSIGIELDNLGDRSFSKQQMLSCVELSLHIKKKYNIDANNFIAHSDVAPDRKIDPGIFFDWQFCANSGLGKWHDFKVVPNTKKLFSFGDVGEGIKQLQQNLSKLGYSIEDTGVFDLQTNFVIRAFQSKYYQDIIHKMGIKFYQDNKSEYIWNSFSDLILQKLLKIF